MTTAADEAMVELVPLTRIRPGLNARPAGELGDLDDLAASIRESGLLQAIVVRPVPADEAGRDLELVCGERRWRAAKLAGLGTIPATVREMGAAEARAAGLLENLQRQDVRPLAQAEGFRVLAAPPFSLTPGEIGRRVGKPTWFVEKALQALDLPPAILDLVRVDRLSYTGAQQLLRVDDATLRARVAKEVVEALRYNHRAPSTAEVREIVVRHLTHLDEALFDVHDARLVPSAGACDDCPHRSANLARTLPLFGAADPEVEGDTCTKPTCYRAKADAHFERLALAVREAGGKVLANARKLFHHPDDPRVRSDASQLDLDAPYDPARGTKSLRELLGDHVDPAAVMLAQDGRGNAHYLVQKAALPKLLERAGIKLREAAHGGTPRVSTPLSVEEKAARRRQQLDKAIEAETRRAILDAVSVAVVDLSAVDRLPEPAPKLLRFVATRLVYALHEAARGVAEHRGYEPKPGAGYDAAERWLGTALEESTAVECLGLLVALAIESGRSPSGQSARHEVKAAALLGVDAKGIRAAVSARVRAAHKERVAVHTAVSRVGAAGENGAVRGGGKSSTGGVFVNPAKRPAKGAPSRADKPKTVLAKKRGGAPASPAA